MGRQVKNRGMMSETLPKNQQHDHEDDNHEVGIQQAAAHGEGGERKGERGSGRMFSPTSSTLLSEAGAMIVFETVDDGIDLGIHLLVGQRAVGAEAEREGDALGALFDPLARIYVEHVDAAE